MSKKVSIWYAQNKTYNTSHLPDTVGTKTCGAAKYGRLTTDTSVDRAFILTDCTILIVDLSI